MSCCSLGVNRKVIDHIRPLQSLNVVRISEYIPAGNRAAKIPRHLKLEATCRVVHSLFHRSVCRPHLLVHARHRGLHRDVVVFGRHADVGWEGGLLDRTPIDHTVLHKDVIGRLLLWREKLLACFDTWNVVYVPLLDQIQFDIPELTWIRERFLVILIDIVRVLRKI